MQSSSESDHSVTEGELGFNAARAHETSDANGSANDKSTAPTLRRTVVEEPSLEPYVGRLERFELFSTNQCFYLVGSNKLNTFYRIIKIDRTLIERPSVLPSPKATSSPLSDDQGSAVHGSNANVAHDSSHKAKPTIRPLADFVTEDPNIYTQEEIKDMLDMIHQGNHMARTDGSSEKGNAGANGGGLKPIVKAYGIVGFIRFLDCYYLTLITKRAKVGSIGGNSIYTIKNTETVPLKPAELGPLPGHDDLDPSSVLLSMWNRGKRSVGLGLTNREIAELRYQGLYQVVDVSKSFFFSYTYDLTRSLQENFLAATSKPFPPPPFKDLYAWNYFLTREFEGCLNKQTSYHWIVPVIHGAFAQRKVNDYGRSLNLVLLARRSRHFAGTRYLKRGVSEQGKVANDVEHEQILHDESKSPSSGLFSSYLQMRGSIPTFWTQESSVTMPKPPIELNRVDPTYNASKLHFEDLMRRYSSPILVLDLVKQSEKREREVRVGDEFRHAIEYVNSTIEEPRHKIRYCALDYSHISKHRNLDVSASLNDCSVWAVNQTGFFCSAPKWKLVEGGYIEPFTERDGRAAAELSNQLGIPVFPMEQHGVLRTNCIDCLDRTNVAQFSAGIEAVGQQLVVMGIRSKAKLDPSATIGRVLIDCYVEIGDQIALQYGGSEAHKKVTAERSESNITPIGKHKELLTSIRRYYSNAFTDRLKQDAMNLFLGYYVPYRHSVPLWELETDYYLHNFHVRAGRGAPFSMKSYQRAFGIQNMDTSFDSGSVSAAAKFSSELFHGHSDDKGLCSRLEDSQTRVLRVQNRCKSQNEALSQWWKAALQSNLHLRIWTSFGQGQAQSMLPPRYERLYQPDKIAQFDKFFNRGWATPVRRSHSAQHSESPGEVAEGVDWVRFASVSSNARDIQKRKAGEADAAKPDRTLASYTRQFGYSPGFDISLKKFSFFHGKDSVSVDFIGQASTVPQAREYLRYVAPSHELYKGPQDFRKEAVKEFDSYLSNYCLDSDDVAGIHELAESAHVGQKLKTGVFRGLTQDKSAVQVATAIQEQLNSFNSKSFDGRQLMESELKRRGLSAPGVKESVALGMKRLAAAEEQYSEIDGTPNVCRRSDLTTASALKLYASAFHGSTELTISDLAFLRGQRSDAEKPHPVKGFSAPLKPTELIKKAERLGVNIMYPSDRADDSQLLDMSWRRKVPAGFEQINEDMFAQKDNKFLVLNGPGVDSWTDSLPVTKVFVAEDALVSR